MKQQLATENFVLLAVHQLNVPGPMMFNSFIIVYHITILSYDLTTWKKSPLIDLA